MSKMPVPSRLEHALGSLQNGRILWVDDHPEWNRDLIRLFERLKMVVHVARSTDEALALVRASTYDVLITDMWRDTEHPSSTAGRTLMDAVSRRRRYPQIIIYAAQFDPKLGLHPAAFGYAKHANELVHLVIDVMERVRFDTEIFARAKQRAALPPLKPTIVPDRQANDNPCLPDDQIPNAGGGNAING